jgi:hypothetical protein
MIRGTPASAASKIESGAKRAGTDIIEQLAPVASTVFTAVLNTGTP